MTISTDLRRISALAIDGNCTPGDLAFLLDQAIIDVEELETNARRLERIFQPVWDDAQAVADGVAHIEAMNQLARDGVLTMFPAARIVRHIDIRAGS